MRPNQEAFFVIEEIINKTKRQSTDWDKIFGNNVTDKVFISKYIYIAHRTINIHI